MTLPHARKIEVDGVEYAYVLKGLSESEATRVRLAVEGPNGKYVTFTFEARMAATDGFGPRDVSAVIRSLDFTRGVLPGAFQLPAWRRVETAARPKAKKKPPQRSASRQSISGHLSQDDLRATVFEDPGLTVDFTRARVHVKSCELCRAMVERERAENPLLQPATEGER